MLSVRERLILELSENTRSWQDVALQMGGSYENLCYVRNQLIKEGVVHLVKKTFLRTGKPNHTYALVNPLPKKDKTISMTWEDGTPKSFGNAFDVSTATGIFSDADKKHFKVSQVVSEFRSKQVIVYSRA